MGLETFLITPHDWLQCDAAAIMKELEGTGHRLLPQLMAAHRGAAFLLQYWEHVESNEHTELSVAY